MKSRAPHMLSQEMLDELALGLEPELEIIHRYGLDTLDWRELQTMPGFLEHIEQRRQELGFDWASLNKAMAQRVLERVFQDAMGPQASPPQRLDILKNLTKWGGLEPVAGAGVAGGGASMTIQINLPNQPAINMASPIAVDGVDTIEGTAPSAFKLDLALLGEPSGD